MVPGKAQMTVEHVLTNTGSKPITTTVYCHNFLTLGAANTAGSSAPLEENIAGMLAYITIIPSIVFLVIEPYNRNRFVRFHCFQNLFFFVAVIVLEMPITGSARP